MAPLKPALIKKKVEVVLLFAMQFLVGKRIHLNVIIVKIILLLAARNRCERKRNEKMQSATKFMKNSYFAKDERIRVVDQLSPPLLRFSSSFIILP